MRLFYLCGKSTAIFYDNDDKRNLCNLNANELVRFAEALSSLSKTGSAEEDGVIGLIKLLDAFS